MKRAGIDWEHVGVRLRASELALDAALTASPERIDAVYRERAALLARTESVRDSASSTGPILIFRLAGARYGIELSEVAGILPHGRCRRVPGAPPYCLGVINFRGELRTVLDLGRFLALEESSNRNAGFVLMLRRGGSKTGLKVDGVAEIREIRLGDLTRFGQGNYTKGIAFGTLALLDAAAIMSSIATE